MPGTDTVQHESAAEVRKNDEMGTGAYFKKQCVGYLPWLAGVFPCVGLTVAGMFVSGSENPDATIQAALVWINAVMFTIEFTFLLAPLCFRGIRKLYYSDYGYEQYEQFLANPVAHWFYFQLLVFYFFAAAVPWYFIYAFTAGEAWVGETLSFGQFTGFFTCAYGALWFAAIPFFLMQQGYCGGSANRTKLFGEDIPAGEGPIYGCLGYLNLLTCISYTAIHLASFFI